MIGSTITIYKKGYVMIITVNKKIQLRREGYKSLFKIYDTLSKVSYVICYGAESWLETSLEAAISLYNNL